MDKDTLKTRKEKIMRAFSIGMEKGIDPHYENNRIHPVTKQPRFLLEIESKAYEYGYRLGLVINDKNWKQ